MVIIGAESLELFVAKSEDNSLGGSCSDTKEALLVERIDHSSDIKGCAAGQEAFVSFDLIPLLVKMVLFI